jgi:hypothetical protein
MSTVQSHLDRWNGNTYLRTGGLPVVLILSFSVIALVFVWQNARTYDISTIRVLSQAMWVVGMTGHLLRGQLTVNRLAKTEADHSELFRVTSDLLLTAPAMILVPVLLLLPRW